MKNKSSMKWGGGFSTPEKKKHLTILYYTFLYTFILALTRKILSNNQSL